MDKKIEILLGNQKNINSINTDSYDKIELSSNKSEIMEFAINDIVDSTLVFDNERQDNPIYRIYGRIEWMSLLNGIKQGHNDLEDFFNPIYTGNSKNILNSFQFYLVAPHPTDSYGSIVGTAGTQRIRSFIVIAGMDDIEIYNAGFSNNVYGEQVYSFSFKSDIDVSNLFDYFGFPVTELFLYAQYIKSSNIVEQMSRTTWTSYGVKSKNNTFTTKDLNVGDDVEDYNGSNIHDIIEYQREDFYQQQLEEQFFYIRTRYNDGGNKWLEWKYNPFIPFRLRYLSDDLDSTKASQVIENTTTLDVIPIYSPSNEFNGTKSQKQTLTTTANVIENWDANTTTYFSWDEEDGYLQFQNNTFYNISFKTKIYLPEGTDQYIAQTDMQEYVGGMWVTIVGTTRKYFSNDDPEQSVNFSKAYLSGNRIRVRVQLIPNPGERKVETIPDYATILTTEGRLVWRDINPQGYVEPLTGVGVDYPFFNERRYLFSPVILNVIPNLTEDVNFKHDPTNLVFEEIWFSPDATTLDITPTKDDLNNVDKPCQ